MIGKIMGYSVWKQRTSGEVRDAKSLSWATTTKQKSKRRKSQHNNSRERLSERCSPSVGRSSRHSSWLRHGEPPFSLLTKKRPHQPSGPPSLSSRPVQGGKLFFGRHSTCLDRFACSKCPARSFSGCEHVVSPGKFLG